MYIICKFFEDWRIYDLRTKTRRSMSPELADILKGLLNDPTKVMEAWQITSIPPNKLQQLQEMQDPPAPRKPADQSPKS
jgi:hypothetical protein